MKQILSEIMREFYELGIPEDVKHRDVEYLEKPHLATVITGMRRTGKTYVTFQRMRELISAGIPLQRIVHVNFDDDRLKGMKLEHLRLIGDIHAELYPEDAKEKCWYFLDELQDVREWELYARRLVDSRLVQLCLTGSSSKLLSSEIATHMRGRSLDVEVFPLSFQEFLSFNALCNEDLLKAPYSARAAGKLKNSWDRYLEIGGFPDVQGCDRRLRIKILQEYVDAVLYRDIIERHDVPSVQGLRYTLDYIKHNFAHKVSTRAIAGTLKSLGISDNREYISDYLEWMEQAYLIYRVPIRTDSLSVRRRNADKFYIVDTGLALAVTPKNDFSKGWLLENLVYLALRRGDNKLEYYITRQGGEVDFVVTDTITKEMRLIQVSWEMPDEKTRKREIDAIKDARKELQVQNSTIVTYEEEGEMDGVRVVPAWKWCLEECCRNRI